MPTALTFAVRAISILALAAALWLLASAEPSQACSCLPHGSPSESLAKSTEVFQGVVTSVHGYDIVDRGDGTWASNDPVTMEFDVSVVWKGQVGKSITIKNGEGRCELRTPIRFGGRIHRLFFRWRHRPVRPNSRSWAGGLQRPGRAGTWAGAGSNNCNANPGADSRAADPGTDRRADRRRRMRAGVVPRGYLVGGAGGRRGVDGARETALDRRPLFPQILQRLRKRLQRLVNRVLVVGG